MKIYYLILEQDMPYEEVEAFEVGVSLERQKKIHRYRLDKDKKTSLFAGLLLRYMLVETWPFLKDSLQFCLGQNGKPYLADHPSCHFSISHSANVVAVAVAENPIGIDVEKTGRALDSLAKRYYTPKEQDYIQNSDNPRESFYEIWTRKEAFIKMTGEGLCRPLDSFEVLEDSRYKSWMLHQLRTEESYAVSLCSEKYNLNSIELIEMTLEKLLSYYKG